MAQATAAEKAGPALTALIKRHRLGRIYFCEQVTPKSLACLLTYHSLPASPGARLWGRQDRTAVLQTQSQVDTWEPVCKLNPRPGCTSPFLASPSPNADVQPAETAAPCMPHRNTREPLASSTSTDAAREVNCSSLGDQSLPACQRSPTSAGNHLRLQLWALPVSGSEGAKGWARQKAGAEGKGPAGAAGAGGEPAAAPARNQLRQQLEKQRLLPCLQSEPCKRRAPGCSRHDGAAGTVTPGSHSLSQRFPDTTTRPGSSYRGL